jgi:hypothetical protein
VNDLYRGAVRGQFEAALAMLAACIDRCPPALWDEPIGKYPFWQVAYHTLCFADCYLAPEDAAWTPQEGPGGLHPRGRAELEDEYPSRRFEQAELAGYAELCLARLRQTLAAETDEALAGPSGFSWLPFTRAELHLYNLRHIQHHTGQLSAFLHRHGIETRWVRSGTG